MNDMNDSTQTQPPPEPQPAGFCQHCGRPLTTATIRQVGPAVYCEPCLAARISGAPGSVPPPPGYGSQIPWRAAAASGIPNPGLAALLGLIPGVGAMYNEQYAKGIVHLIVFAVLVSLSDNVNGVFGLFVAGWVCYMAIEAHHTARARRDGTPLPNPFGLNDIGERLGFGKSWPPGPSAAQVASDAAAAAAAGFHQAVPPSPAAYQTPPAAETWGAPTDSYTQVAPTYAAQPQPDYTQPFGHTAYNQAYRDVGYGAGVPVPPYAPTTAYPQAPYTPYDPAAFVPSPSRFPAGAVWLIGLGVLFLLTTTGIFNGVPAESLVGCVLLGIAAWIFLRRMTDTGAGLVSDGAPAYSMRVFRALRFSVWLGFVGLLFLFNAFNILPWRHSWPLLIILAGAMALLHRAAFQASAAAYMQQPPFAPSPVAAGPAAQASAAAHGDSTQGGN